MRIPLLIRLFQCRSCSLNGRLKNPAAICMAHGGMVPVVWTKIFIQYCVSKRTDIIPVEGILPSRQQLKLALRGHRLVPVSRTQISKVTGAMKNIEKQNRMPKSYPGKFKPRTAHEKRLWKPERRPEEDE